MASRVPLYFSKSLGSGLNLLAGNLGSEQPVSLSGSPSRLSAIVLAILNPQLDQGCIRFLLVFFVVFRLHARHDTSRK